MLTPVNPIQLILAMSKFLWYLHSDYQETEPSICVFWAYLIGLRLLNHQLFTTQQELFSDPSQAPLDLLHWPQVGRHLEDTRQIVRRKEMSQGYDTCSQKMNYSSGSQTVALLTAKSVPVHALISSGVSPSNTSIRVRPFVLSTSNTAWRRETGQKEREGAEGKKKV